MPQFYYLLNLSNLVNLIIFITSDSFFIGALYLNHLIYMNLYQITFIIEIFENESPICFKSLALRLLLDQCFSDQ